MTNLKDARIDTILPVNMRTSEAVSFGYALQKAIEKLLTYADHVGVEYDIARLPESVLDERAQELRTQYYNSDLSLDVKQGLVQNTMPWYSKAGTSSAVKELIETVFGSGNVIEWFKYNGTPYCFKAGTDEVLQPGMFDNFTAMIDNVKNASSKLEAVTVNRLAEKDVSTGCCFRLSYRNAPIRMEVE